MFLVQVTFLSVHIAFLVVHQTFLGCNWLLILAYRGCSLLLLWCSWLSELKNDSFPPIAVLYILSLLSSACLRCLIIVILSLFGSFFDEGKLFLHAGTVSHSIVDILLVQGGLLTMCPGDTLPAAFTGCAWVAVIVRAYHHDASVLNS